jgi:hypothetical protein
MKWKWFAQRARTGWWALTPALAMGFKVNTIMYLHWVIQVEWLEWRIGVGFYRPRKDDE